MQAKTRARLLLRETVPKDNVDVNTIFHCAPNNERQGESILQSLIPTANAINALAWPGFALIKIFATFMRKIIKLFAFQ
jgi:hypothetical protein